MAFILNPFTGKFDFVGTSGAGTVTGVSFTGGIISVTNPTTVPALTVSGASGGIPYFSGAATWASSALLALNSLMVGGGAGAAPTTVTTGTGILAALGVNVGVAGAPVLFNGDLGTPLSGVLTNCTGLPNASVIGLGTMAFQDVSAVSITGGTVAGLTSFGVRSTGAAFDLKFTSSEAITADHTLSFILGDMDQVLSLTGSPTLSGVTITDSGTIGTTAGKTFTFSNTLTLAGVDGATLDVGGGGILGTAAFADLTAFFSTSDTIPVSRGGTGRNNPGGALILPAADTTIVSGGVLDLGGATLTVSASGTAALLGVAQTFSSLNTFNANPSASTSAIKLIGTPTTGTGTTAFPLLYLNQNTATASTTLNTAGTFIGVNSHGTADLMNLMKDGVFVFKVANTLVTVGSGVALKLGNAAVTGLTPAVSAGLLTKSITIQDSTGATITLYGS